MGNCICRDANPTDPALLSHVADTLPVSHGFAQTFLGYIGLSIYAQAFELCGYDNEALLCHLDAMDLNKIERASHVPILPAHRAQILTASAKLQEYRKGMWVKRSQAALLLLDPATPGLAIGNSSHINSSQIGSGSSFSSSVCPQPRTRQLPSPARTSQRQLQGQQLQKEEQPLLMQHSHHSNSSSSSSEWLAAWMPADTVMTSSADAAAAASTRASNQAVAVVFGDVQRGKDKDSSSRQRARQQYSMLPETVAESTPGAFTKMAPVLQSGYLQFAPCGQNNMQLTDSACSSDFMQH